MAIRSTGKAFPLPRPPALLLWTNASRTTFSERPRRRCSAQTAPAMCVLSECLIHHKTRLNVNDAFIVLSPLRHLAPPHPCMLTSLHARIPACTYPCSRLFCFQISNLEFQISNPPFPLRSLPFLRCKNVSRFCLPVSLSSFLFSLPRTLLHASLPRPARRRLEQHRAGPS